MNRQEIEKRVSEGETVFHYRFDDVRWSPVWTEILVTEVTDTHVIGRIPDNEQQDWSTELHKYPIEEIETHDDYNRAMDCQAIDNDILMNAK